MEVTVPLSGKARLKFCIAEMEAAHTVYHFSLAIEGADATGNIFCVLTREELLALPEAIATGFREAEKIGCWSRGRCPAKRGRCFFSVILPS